MWAGSMVGIPAGWNLCDGSNGTPDMSDRFVVGAGDSYDPGDFAGSLTHEHPFTGDGHFHDLKIGAGLNAGTIIGDKTLSTSSTGLASGGQNIIPYYALCWIQYLGA